MARLVILWTLLTALMAPISGAVDSGGSPTVVISVRDQKMGVVRAGKTVATFPISTSKYGVGDRFGSYRTPLGNMAIASKIGNGLRSGAVLKGRVPTGEVLKPNAPGRDPIVTRIMVLRGLEEQNRNATSRGIYIHGTTEENRIGKAVSFGCIRMTSEDVITFYGLVDVGTRVVITEEKLKPACKAIGKSVTKETMAGSEKDGAMGAPYANSAESI